MIFTGHPHRFLVVVRSAIDRPHGEWLLENGSHDEDRAKTPYFCACARGYQDVLLLDTRSLTVIGRYLGRVRAGVVAA